MDLGIDLSDEALDALSPEDRRELLANLEAYHVAKRREDIKEFARYIQIPGTPSPLTVAERKAVAARLRLTDTIAELPELEPGEDEYYVKRLEPAAHHDLIMDAIQGLMENRPVIGPLANGMTDIVPDGVMLFLPPGSAKSSYASIVCPSYIMGRWPGTEVICASYAAELARKFARRVRTVVKSPEYYETFGATIVGDNQAVDSWSLDNGSTYRAVGILGGVTGNRAGLLIIDDPIAGREEAESEVIREKLNDAMRDDILTRLLPIPIGKTVICQTRWHEDDPAGRLLGEDWMGHSGLWKGTDGRWWLVLCMPLVCERSDDPLGRRVGEILWPEWFTDREVEVRKAAGDRSYSSLQQQRPSASGGNIMMRDWWKCWSHGRSEPDPEQMLAPPKPPADWRQCFLSYDTAFEEDEDNDYSAMTAWISFALGSGLQDRAKGKEVEQQNLCLTGAWRAKVDAADLIDIIMDDHIPRVRPDFILIEKRASGIQLLQELRRRRPRYTEPGGYVRYVQIIDWLPPGKPGAKGKRPRAFAAATILGEGTVWYMPGSKSILEALKEAAAFPNGKHDDLCFTAGTMIALRRGLVPIEEVVVGDEALTPFGWKRVSAAALTGVREVVSAAGLTGTANHPVHTLDGWVPLGVVKATDTITQVKVWSLTRAIRQLKSSSMERSSTGWVEGESIISKRGSSAEGHAHAGSTSQSGSTPTGEQSPSGMRSTTSTATHLIAALKIWSAYQRLSIARSLSALIARLGRVNSTTSEVAPPSGTDLLMAGRGIEKMRAGWVWGHLRSGATSSQSDPSHAANAGPSSSGPIREKSSAGHPAKTDTRSDADVRLAPVFNLTVEDAHCYFANGVLVHNCDTITQALIYSRKLNLLELPTDILNDQEEFTRERDELDRIHDARPLYGNSGTKGKKQWVRSLYGASKSKARSPVD